MQISEQLRCLFSGRVEERDGSYVLEVPKQELELGDITEGQTYQVAVLSTPSESTQSTSGESSGPTSGSDQQSQTRNRTAEQSDGALEPPVDEGETRTVDIESVGDQGDGITRVERGFVVIVPETEKGERVRIEITQVRENVAFADVLERLEYYE